MRMRCPETLALWLTQHRPIDDYPCAYFDLGTSLALASSRRLAGRERTSDQVARWSRTELTAFEQVIRVRPDIDRRPNASPAATR